MTSRKPLGRGLSALIPPKEEPVRSVPLSMLRPNRLQPRSSFDEAALEELAQSIRIQGVVQPLVVTEGNNGVHTIIAGERRYRAAQRAGLVAVPVVVRSVRDDRQLLELALVENLQRADLNPLEEAEAFRALHTDFGLSQEEIALRVGKARSAVSNALRLLRLPREVQELLRSGALSAGQARPLLALENESEIVRLALRAAKEGLSARDLEALAAGDRPRSRKRKGGPAEVHAAAAAERLTRHLQTRVEIERRRKGGILKIHFHSEEELMRLFDLFMQTRGAR